MTAEPPATITRTPPAGSITEEPVSEARIPSFQRAVVALSGHPGNDRIVRLAAEMAQASKAELIAVHVVEVDWSQPLDADIAGRSEAAQRILDRAEEVAETHGRPLDSVLLQARDVGAAIVDEAIEREADLLIMGLAYRMRFGGDFAIGRTIPYVLKNAPCAVWVVREPIPEEAS